MRITLISPNIVSQKGDFFGTGIPYFPLVIAYTASYLRSKGHKINLIDAFGENTTQVTEKDNKFIQGLTPQEALNKIPKDTELIFISAERVVAHQSIIDIIRTIKCSEIKNTPIAILENTQAVTAYALKNVKERFFNEGINYLITGEPEKRVENFCSALKENNKIKRESLLKKIDGLIYKDHKGKIIENKIEGIITDPDILPFPAWDLFHLKNYWKLRYAHGPLSSKKYLPLLTSRGCPFPCTFCVVPSTNKQKWRPRSAKNVVDEIERFTKEFGVTEYHLEDLNPTIRKDRMIEIAKEIIKRNLKISWKISSGTKVETLDEETIRWMAKSGCSYISISPESGSSRIMKMMRKPFPYDRALELVREMQRNKITTQACFILGYPKEEKEDIKKTKEYIKQIVKAGIDEVAILILTPAPGSVIFEEYSKENELDDLTKLTFTPTWRKDFKKYDKERKRLYLYFFLWRCIYYPLDVIKQPINLITKRFDTKMEMTLYRVFKVWKMCKFYK